MAWTKFVVPEKPSTAGTGLKVTLAKRKGGTPAKLLMTFSAPLAGRLSFAGGDKLEVLIGDGAQHGLVRLRKNNSAGGSAIVEEKTSAIGNKAKYFKVVLGVVPGLVDRSESARWAQFEQIDEGGWVEICLPSWARETAPRTGAQPAAVPVSPLVAEAAHFQRPKRDAAPRMMGDPDPSRSALAQRKTA